MAKNIDTFGKKIKYLRKDKGLTQVELAKDLFLDKSTIAKYETDKIAPTGEVIKTFALYFKVSANYLLGLED